MLPPLRLRLRLWYSLRTTADVVLDWLRSIRLALRLGLPRIYARILRIWARLFHQVLSVRGRLLILRLSRLLVILLLLLLSTSVRSLLIPRIILPFLPWWPFFIPVMWSSTLLVRTLMPSIVGVLILRRLLSSVLSHILVVSIVILLLVASVP